MKVLCTSDWHMGIYQDPSDSLKLSNDRLLSLLRKWEAEYGLILINGDILNVLKTARIFFSHIEQAYRIMRNREPIIDRLVSNPKYVLTVGNHDYPLETILNLPVQVRLELDNNYTLIAEHGHLLRAPREHYSSYAWHYHLVYCLSWWMDRMGAQLDPEFSAEVWIETLIHWLWSQRQESAGLVAMLKEQLAVWLCSYGSWKGSRSYRHLPRLLLAAAQERFGTSNTVVVFGHSHLSEIYHQGNGNIYINPGVFGGRNQFSATEFDSSTGVVRRVHFGVD